MAPHPNTRPEDDLAGRVCAQSGPRDYSSAGDVQVTVREALQALRLPESFISPGDRVVLKPNWVKEHEKTECGKHRWLVSSLAASSLGKRG
jgi:uncharacterized protein (DUF362 family)